ncbi:unnamed protein product [Somion occarium]|uniref:FAD-binding domain-containing protein n=1 Tax=Somion occarium TaxID=3059160 RepID=A0ABP1DKW8_9APHY
MPELGTKVIIVGCAIAGPVLAMFLLGQGYVPVVYERLDALTEGGVSLMLQPNGLRVLAQIPGLEESLEGGAIARILFESVVPEDKGVLSESYVLGKLKEELGFGLLGVARSSFHRKLVEAAEQRGIKIIWGHQLIDLEQHEDHVTVTFQNGNTDTASFVVGCDGLHSNTRICLFGKEQADFTGLVQIGGASPAPPGRPFELPTMLSVFGNGEHFIAYAVSDNRYSWAGTRREPEAKETWKAMDKDAQEDFKKNSSYSSWGAGVGDLVRNADKVVKYGLYDRPELTTWHSGRVILIGDAAHPTSPHLGQGANQAFEDVALLSKLLKEHNPHANPPSTETLSKVFTELEKVRIPRSAALVAGARKSGETRVVAGVEECKKRNDYYRESWKDDETIMRNHRAVYAAQ